MTTNEYKALREREKALIDRLEGEIRAARGRIKCARTQCTHKDYSGVVRPRAVVASAPNKSPVKTVLVCEACGQRISKPKS